MSAAASTIPAQSMNIAKVKEHIGAIVTGIDLAHPVDGATQKKLYDAVVENVVLVIRGQEHLTPGQVQAAGEMFGDDRLNAVLRSQTHSTAASTVDAILKAVTDFQAGTDHFDDETVVVLRVL